MGNSDNGLHQFQHATCLCCVSRALARWRVSELRYRGNHRCQRLSRTRLRPRGIGDAPKPDIRHGRYVFRALVREVRLLDVPEDQRIGGVSEVALRPSARVTAGGRNGLHSSPSKDCTAAVRCWPHCRGFCRYSTSKRFALLRSDEMPYLSGCLISLVLRTVASNR
jgi:hypothetical protein